MNKKIMSLSIVALGALTLLGGGCIKKGTPTTIEDITPSISVSDQPLGSGNQITVNKAAISKNGWLVIYAKENGRPGSILVYTALYTGEENKIKITIVKTKLTASLIAMLHYDQGTNGVFEFSGTDGIVIRDQKVIRQEFNLTDCSK